MITRSMPTHGITQTTVRLGLNDPWSSVNVFDFKFKAAQWKLLSHSELSSYCVKLPREKNVCYVAIDHDWQAICCATGSRLNRAPNLS